MDLVWSTFEHRSRRRAEALEELLTWGIPYPLGLSRGLHEDVSATMRLKRFEGHGLIDFRADPIDRLHVHRSSSEIQRTDGTFLCVIQVLGAAQEFQIGKDEFTAAKGDFLLYKNEQEAHWSGPGPYRQLVMFFPTERLCGVIPDVHGHLGKPVDGRRGLGALFTTQMRTLAREMTDMECDDLSAAMLLTSLQLADALGAAAALSPENWRTVTRERARRYILPRLHQSDLTPARIAGALGISVRYLHLVFESGNTTVGTWVRRQRLERCRHDILMIGHTGRSITEIAYSWGFNDSSHFAKAFRQEYGLSPTEYRDRTRIAAAGPDED